MNALIAAAGSMQSKFSMQANGFTIFISIVSVIAVCVLAWLSWSKSGFKRSIGLLETVANRFGLPSSVFY